MMNVKKTPIRAVTLSLSFALSASIWLPQLSGAAEAVDHTITGSVGSYASTAALVRSGKGGAVLDAKPASATLKNGLKSISRGEIGPALTARKALPSGSLERKVMAWAIAVYGRGVDARTLHKISQDLSHWPSTKAMRINLERVLIDGNSSQALRVAFGATRPESDGATIALAIAHRKAGANKAAQRTIAHLWRTSKLSRNQERKILKTLGPVLAKADHRARVEYLLSNRRIRGAERIAGLAGATRMVKARAAVERKLKSASSALSAVPAFQKNDPNYLLSKARWLRKADRFTAAAKVLLSVPRKKILAESADLHWTEQRIVASELLNKSPKTAYRLASANIAHSKTKRIDSEFYAGWIALRRLKQADRASDHFARLLKLAGTPLSKSRGHYWMGRALAKSGNKQGSAKHYAAAAQFDTTYYGQLATLKLGRKSISVSKARPTRTDRARYPKFELVQAIAKLQSAGQHRMARPFYRFLARNLTRPGELALLAARAEKAGDYQLGLQVGKIGFIRGFDVDALAWPIGAIPKSTKTSGAGLPLAYAIARQESTFKIDARSSANALGLLQLLPGTAKRTARSLGIKYSKSRLTSDASYNARLGTAYLRKQMESFGGSLILTFSAYNAGPLRAKDWIIRNGDPRGKSLDIAIDWVEKIPYAETRNYVQRVMENYQVYKTRLKGHRLSIGSDLRLGAKS